MQFPTLFTLAAATLMSFVKADFQIYQVIGVDALSADPKEDWQIFDGEPSCNDASNGYAVFSEMSDVSKTPGVRCKGCGDRKDIRDPGWDIDELEMNGDGWGHYTIYKSRGYKIEPKGNGPSKGECKPDTGEDFMCTNGLVTTKGQRIFTCKSELKGRKGK